MKIYFLIMKRKRCIYLYNRLFPLKSVFQVARSRVPVLRKRNGLLYNLSVYECIIQFKKDKKKKVFFRMTRKKNIGRQSKVKTSWAEDLRVIQSQLSFRNMS